MPAYTVALQRRCETSGCPRFATQEVRNTWNATMGVYCAKHASELVRTLNHEYALCDVPHLDLGLRCTRKPGHKGMHRAKDLGRPGRQVEWTAPEYDR